MPNELPIAAQRKILSLERQNFKLEQKLIAMKHKYQTQIADLQSENHKLKTQPMRMGEEERRQLMEAKQRAIDDWEQENRS